MSDDLFHKVIEDCTEFPLETIEPFLNGEPFVDPKIMSRLEYIRSRLPRTKLRLYTNGYALTPDRIDDLCRLGVDALCVSINSLDPQKHRKTMGLELGRILDNLDYLTDPRRCKRVAGRISFRMTRTADTTVEEQDTFLQYCKDRGVRAFIVGLFNYKGDIHSDLPVPTYPCEHITRVDILSNGTVTLCCMDQDGDYAWGDVHNESILSIYGGDIANRYRQYHRAGHRSELKPCDTCNMFWPSLSHMPLLRTARFALDAGFYFVRYRPAGKKRSSGRTGLLSGA